MHLPHVELLVVLWSHCLPCCRPQREPCMYLCFHCSCVSYHFHDLNIHLLLPRELQLVALVTILSPVVMVLIFSLRVLGIYYVHSKKLSKLKSEKLLRNAPDLQTSGYRLVLFKMALTGL